MTTHHHNGQHHHGEHKRYHRALNILAKWRSLLAGWQLGTRPAGDPECDAVRDHREATLVLRAEVTALTSLLVGKGIVTVDELFDAVADAADDQCTRLQTSFPGVTATEHGLVIDHRALAWMKGWRP